MFNGMKTSKLATFGEKLSKYLIVKIVVIGSGPNEIWSGDLIGMREFYNDNKDYNYLLNVIDIFCKYAWSVPLKTKTGTEIAKAFESIMTKNHPKKLWVDQDTEFYNEIVDKLRKSKSIELKRC